MAQQSMSCPSHGRKGWLLGFGHPLLDITTYVDNEFLFKYNLKSDDAILADVDRHGKLISDLMSGSSDIQYSAGGATQNAIRVAQAFVWSQSNETLVTSFMGSVGKDHFASRMKTLIEKEGVNAYYHEVTEKPTGKCVVLLSNRGLDRSLVTFLDAANCFKLQNVHWPSVASSRVIYTAGFTLGNSFEVCKALADHCSASAIANEENGEKIFCLNLSANYIATAYTEQLMQMLPLINILFGNASEVQSLARSLNWEETCLKEIVGKLTRVPNTIVGNRVVIITRNCEPIYLATSDSSVVKEVPVPPASNIIDTNCAGDAFVGGFLGHLIQYGFDQHGKLRGKLSLNDTLGSELLVKSITSGIKCAQLIMQTIGCNTHSITKLPLQS